MTYMNNTTTKNMKNKIITFSCSNLVHIYEPNSSLLPRFPFKSHKDIDSAKKHLELMGKEKIGIKIIK